MSPASRGSRRVWWGAFVLLYGPEQLARVEEEVHLNYSHVPLCICMYTTQLGTLVQPSFTVPPDQIFTLYC